MRQTTAPREPAAVCPRSHASRHHCSRADRRAGRRTLFPNPTHRSHSDIWGRVPETGNSRISVWLTMRRCMTRCRTTVRVADHGSRLVGTGRSAAPCTTSFVAGGRPTPAGHRFLSTNPPRMHRRRAPEGPPENALVDYWHRDRVRDVVSVRAHLGGPGSGHATGGNP